MIRYEFERDRQFTRRSLIIGGVQAMGFMTLTAKLYGLQIIEGERFRTLSEGNRIRLYPVIPVRGKILDRTGKIVAHSTQRFQLLYDDDRTATPEILQTVAKLLNLPSFTLDEWKEKIAAHKRRESLVLMDYLQWPDVARIETFQHELPGIYVDTELIRHYPYLDMAVHWLGYVGIVSKPDEEEKRILRRYPQFKIGKAGMEYSLEKHLRGTVGAREVEVDVHGKKIRELTEKEAVSSKPTRTSIHMELQQFITEQLRGKGGLISEGGSVVVMDIHTGHILSMVSLPGYDPNQFARGVSRDQWKEWSEHPDSPLTNKVIARHYSPGSTFKTLMAVAGLHYRTVSPEDKVFCNGGYRFGNRTYKCWWEPGHGEVNLRKALAISCNVYFYDLARKLGIENIARISREFGLGEKLGIEIPGEIPGLVPDSEWKRKTFKESWYPGETLSIGIGQGYMLVTPLQLVTMMARIASKGKLIKPTIWMESPTKNGSNERMSVQPWHFDPVLEGMNQSINVPGGIIYAQRLLDPAKQFAAKTGTVQVLSKRFAFKEIPSIRAERHHAMCIAFAPVKEPRFAAVVVVEHGGFGSATAAPIMRSIMEKVQSLTDI